MVVCVWTFDQTIDRPQALAARAAQLVRVDYQADGDRCPIVSLEDAIRMGSLYDEQGTLRRGQCLPCRDGHLCIEYMTPF